MTIAGICIDSGSTPRPECGLSSCRLAEGISLDIDRQTEMAMINTTLHHRVFSALEENVYLRGRRFHLEAEQGRITLRGTVRSYYQKQMAQEAVRKVDGVNEIANELEVCQI